jgi:SAM-dependent methyltransferase
VTATPHPSSPPAHSSQRDDSTPLQPRGDQPEQSGPTPDAGPANRWLAATGGTRGAAYAERFRRLADQGADVHGEARLLDGLLRRHLDGPGRVLDAGCGTGRVAVELARRGHQVVGVDLDESMLEQARAASATAGLDVRWVLGDLLDLDRLVEAESFDLVAAPGNVLVFLTPGTEPDVVAALAAALRPGGLLVAGFAHDRHVSRVDYAGWCERAGLEHLQSLATWEGAADEGGDYAIHVHRRLRERL